MQRAALARSVASGERYLDALRVQDAASRASQLRHLTHGTPQDATRTGRADTAAFASRQRYAAAVAARPRYTLRPGLTPEERLWLHTVATMPYEMALMVRLDPVVRSVAVGGAATVAVATAPVAYVATEDLALEGLERSAALLETEGAMLSAQLQAVTFRSFFTKLLISGIGQGVGNYVVKRDAASAIQNINVLSAVASGLNIPLGYNSLFSAGFSLTYDKGLKSIATGNISTYEFGRDAAFNYAFGKLSAGFKLPGSASRSWIGLDKLYQTRPVDYSVGFTTYQVMLRTSPRLGYGLGLGLSTGLEHSNKVVVGAAKKVLGTEIKHHLPDPAK
jgi:hypothetical protein